jgi:sec-independent protein translocase protein TatA
MMNSLVAVPGGWELVLIVLVILLLFGAKKLPELARGSGRALRIFKAETKGLVDDDDVDEGQKTPEEREIEARSAQPEPPLAGTDDPAHPVVRDNRDGQAS